MTELCILVIESEVSQVGGNSFTSGTAPLAIISSSVSFKWGKALSLVDDAQIEAKFTSYSVPQQNF
jgi:hypothetical protein